MTPEQRQTANDRHEPSAWLRAALTARTREVDAQRGDADRVVTFLTPHGERTCDRCGTTVTLGTAPFFAQVLRPQPWLQIIGGLCEPCHDVEVVKR